jgi:hypothetical protein
MPLKYDPDTGIPSYVNDDATEYEIEEGVTPKAEPFTKAGFFAGDPKPKLKKPPVILDERPIHKGITIEAYAIPPEDMNKALDEAIDRITEPSKLDAHVATDAEVDEIERLAKSHGVMHWPTLLRLINRLRLAEGRL